MSDVLDDLGEYADHRGYPEELPNFSPTASRARSEIIRLRSKSDTALIRIRDLEEVLRLAKSFIVISHLAPPVHEFERKTSDQHCKNIIAEIDAALSSKDQEKTNG